MTDETRTRGKYGKLPPHDEATHPKLKLADFLDHAAAAEALPDRADYVSEARETPMYENDKWGNCVPAGGGHALAGITANAGDEVDASDAEVLGWYHDVAGFDPNAGPPGDNPTDNGTVIQDFMGYWHKTGLDGHRIAAYALVDPKNEVEVKAAIYYFEHLLAGFVVYKSCEDQFDAGQPWTVVPDMGPELGGHCVVVAYYDPEQLKAITWGTIQPAALDYFAKTGDEMWIALTEDAINKATGKAPAGLDVTAMWAKYAELTGTVVEPPAPGPDPTPSYVSDTRLKRAEETLNTARETANTARAAFDAESSDDNAKALETAEAAEVEAQEQWNTLYPVWAATHGR